jgi:hypothetical protein
MDSPITATNSAAAAIHPLRLLENNRRTVDRNRRSVGQRACSAMVTDVGHAGEGVGVAGGPVPEPLEPPTSGGSEVALETGRAGKVSWGLGES